MSGTYYTYYTYYTRSLSLSLSLDVYDLLHIIVTMFSGILSIIFIYIRYKVHGFTLPFLIVALYNHVTIYLDISPSRQDREDPCVFSAVSPGFCSIFSKIVTFLHEVPPLVRPGLAVYFLRS